MPLEEVGKDFSSLLFVHDPQKRAGDTTGFASDIRARLSSGLSTPSEVGHFQRPTYLDRPIFIPAGAAQAA
jgi:hypothetical protein